MAKTFVALFFMLTLFHGMATAQKTFRVMSYNVENFFDTTDNPEKDDDEFLPTGKRRWTDKRYRHKLSNIARVINATGKWSTPALVALCEVENDTVVTHLINRTSLRHRHYSYSMTHGSDRRGINSALLYQRNMFQYIGHNEYNVSFTDSSDRKTRDILHVWGTVAARDTLDVFVCHFPSRYKGEKESEANRSDAAQLLRHVCDSLLSSRSTPMILVMGDFNDTEESKSLADILSLKQPEENADAHRLYNLFADSDIRGSHKYRGEWNKLDHIIVSGNLLSPLSSLRFVPGSNRVFAPPFLLTRDKTYGGERPMRTYQGLKYEGGFSDHLPVISDFYISPPRKMPPKHFPALCNVALTPK